MKKIILLLCLGLLFAQTDDTYSLFPSSETVLDSLTQNYTKIEDYYTEIELSINTKVLRMPRKKVEFWFKQPNLTKAEAKGFAAIPKSGLIASPVDLFDNLKDVSVVGAEYYKDSQVWILRGTLNPDSLTFKNMNDYNDRLDLSMRLYVDRKRWIVLRSETWIDTIQVIEIESEYKEVKDDIYLPKETIIQFQYSKDLTAEIENSIQSTDHIVSIKRDMVLDSETGEELMEQEFSGLITLKFSKYKVNQGLDDSFFDSEEPNDD